MDYRSLLRAELAKRCERNPRYSLRAYARDLELSPSRLSHVLKGDYGLSREAGERIALKLGWNELERAHFADRIESEHGRSALKRRLAVDRIKTSPRDYQSLTADHYRMVADWYHFAILEVLRNDAFRKLPADSAHRAIAQALSISPHEAAAALERLQRLKLLEVHHGFYRVRGDFAANPSGIPSEAIRKSHRQILAKAEIALDLQSVDERDFSAMILAVDEADLPEAKQMLRDFRRSFDQRFSAKAGRKNRVYCLGLQFFSLQEKPAPKGKKK